MKRRGLKYDPQLAIGDNALGFWKALPQVFSSTREQRCWVHKTTNMLNKFPKHLQPKAKSDLHQIWMAETRAAGALRPAGFCVFDVMSIAHRAIAGAK